MSKFDRQGYRHWLKENWKLLAVILVVILLLITPLFEWLNLDEMVARLQVMRQNPWTPYIYISLLIIFSLLAIPTLILTVLAGPLFGFWEGLLLATVGLNIGCNLTFVIARILGGRKIMRRLIPRGHKAEQIASQINRDGFRILVYLRFILVIPYNIINYISGMTTVRYRDYALGSFIGMLPGTMMYIYVSLRAIALRDQPWEFIAAFALLLLFIAALGIRGRGKQKQHSDQN